MHGMARRARKGSGLRTAEYFVSGEWKGVRRLQGSTVSGGTHSGLREASLALYCDRKSSLCAPSCNRDVFLK